MIPHSGGAHRPKLVADPRGLLLRITGCTCGWIVPPHTQDFDTAFTDHAVLAGLRACKPFNGVKIFAATLPAPRAQLGATVTTWLERMHQRPGFEIVDIVTTQSSDAAYHCLTISIFYREDVSS